MMTDGHINDDGWTHEWWRMDTSMMADGHMNDDRWTHEWWQMDTYMMTDRHINDYGWRHQWWQMDTYMMTDGHINDDGWTHEWWQMDTSMMTNGRINNYGWTHQWWRMDTLMMTDDRSVITTKLYDTDLRRVRRDAGTTCPKTFAFVLINVSGTGTVNYLHFTELYITNFTILQGMADTMSIIRLTSTHLLMKDKITQYEFVSSNLKTSNSLRQIYGTVWFKVVHFLTVFASHLWR